MSDLKAALLRCHLVIAKSLKVVGSQRPSSSSGSASSNPPPNLHQALLAVLTHLRKDITALSLAFSGAKITIDAGIVQLGKVGTEFEQLGACVVILNEGSYLKKEWARGVEQIGSGLQRLCEIFVADIQARSKNPGETRSAQSKATTSTCSQNPPEPYLVQTSSLWTQIDSLLTNSSPTELAAVQKILLADRECMDDGMREFKEILEEDEGVGKEEEDHAEVEEEGEWGDLERELGGSGGESMSEQERERVKKLDMILRLAIALHNRLSISVLPLIPFKVDYDSYLNQSHSLSSDLDNLVSSLYAPQDVQEVKSASTSIANRIRALCQKCLEDLGQPVDSLSVDLGTLALEGEGKPSGKPLEAGAKATGEQAEKAKKVEKERKWLGLWTVQLDKAWKQWEGM